MIYRSVVRGMEHDLRLRRKSGFILKECQKTAFNLSPFVPSRRSGAKGSVSEE
jgi:hypothetical protein